MKRNRSCNFNSLGLILLFINFRGTCPPGFIGVLSSTQDVEEVRDSARFAVREVLSLWNMTHIPTTIERNAVEKLKQLFDKWIKLMMSEHNSNGKRGCFSGRH